MHQLDSSWQKSVLIRAASATSSRRADDLPRLLNLVGADCCFEGIDEPLLELGIVLTVRCSHLDLPGWTVAGTFNYPWTRLADSSAIFAVLVQGVDDVFGVTPADVDLAIPEADSQIAFLWSLPYFVASAYGCCVADGAQEQCGQDGSEHVEAVRRFFEAGLMVWIE